MKEYHISVTVTTEDDVELTEKDFADALHRVPMFTVEDVHIERVEEPYTGNLADEETDAERNV